MVETDSPKSKANPGWLRVVLFVSLVLNLLIVGLIVGTFYRVGSGIRGHVHENPPMYNLGYGAFGRALSADDRHNIGRALASRAEDLTANREDFRVSSLALLRALRAVPFEPAAVIKAMSEQQNKLLERQNIGKSLLLA
ncbi:MAG: periplasmic heavy metal sensor, partial [Paracoccaceae bacterium]